MKSKVFRRFDTHTEKNKQFIRDLELALGLTETQRNLCSDALVAYLLASVETEENRILEELEQSSKLPQITLLPVLRVMGFLLRQAIGPETEGDEPEEWAEDLRSAKASVLKSDEEQAAFVNMAKHVLRATDAYRRAHKLRAYAQGVLPMFNSCGHTVELRAVQNESYKWGQAIDEYAPQIIGQVPIISVHVGTDADSNSDFNFQMREDHLTRLINELEAARLELSAFRRYLGVKRDDS